MARGGSSRRKIGIPEHFEFTGACIAGSNAAAHALVGVSDDDRMLAELQRLRPHSDNLLHFGSVDALRNGSWTFLRVHDRPEIIAELQPDEIARRAALDQNRPGGQAETVIRALLNGQAPAVAAADLGAQDRDLLSLLDLDPAAPFDPDPPTVLVSPAECRGDMVEATVAAVSARRAFPTDGTPDTDQALEMRLELGDPATGQPAQPQAGQSLCLPLSLRDTVTGAAPRGIRPRFFARPVQPGIAGCEMAGSAFLATGCTPEGPFMLYPVALPPGLSLQAAVGLISKEDTPRSATPLVLHRVLGPPCRAGRAGAAVRPA